MLRELSYKQRQIIAARVVMRAITNKPDILQTDQTFVYLAQAIHRSGLSKGMTSPLISENEAKEWLKRFFPVGTVAKIALSLGHELLFPFYGEQLDWSFLMPEGNTKREKIENVIIEDIFT